MSGRTARPNYRSIEVYLQPVGSTRLPFRPVYTYLQLSAYFVFNPIWPDRARAVHLGVMRQTRPPLILSNLIGSPSGRARAGCYLTLGPCFGKKVPGAFVPWGSTLWELVTGYYKHKPKTYSIGPNLPAPSPGTWHWALGGK